MIWKKIDSEVFQKKEFWIFCQRVCTATLQTTLKIGLIFEKSINVLEQKLKIVIKN